MCRFLHMVNFWDISPGSKESPNHRIKSPQRSKTWGQRQTINLVTAGETRRSATNPSALWIFLSAFALSLGSLQYLTFKRKKIHHVTKSVQQLCSAPMITTDMPLAQHESLIPKVCYSWPSPNSDRWIRSTRPLKTSSAINSFAPRGMPDHHSTIITPSTRFCFWRVLWALSNGL